jgi:hypothetical protein
MSTRDLEKCTPSSRRPPRDLHADQELSGGESSREETREEVDRPDPPLAGKTSENERGIQRDHHRGKLGARIGVGEAAAERAATPDLRVRDVRHRFGQQWRVLPDKLTPLDGCVTGHGPDPQSSIREARDPGQLADTIEIH